MLWLSNSVVCACKICWERQNCSVSECWFHCSALDVVCVCYITILWLSAMHCISHWHQQGVIIELCIFWPSTHWVHVIENFEENFCLSEKKILVMITEWSCFLVWNHVCALWAASNSRKHFRILSSPVWNLRLHPAIMYTVLCVNYWLWKAYFTSSQ